MIGWHHQFYGHKFEQVLRVGEEQGSLVCYSPWAHKQSDMTELLNNNSMFLIKLEINTKMLTREFSNVWK